MQSRSLVLTTLLGVLAAAPIASAQSGSGGNQSGSQARAGASATEISLAVGEQYVLAASNIRSYSLAAEGIVDVRVPSDGSRLLIVGQRAGNTSLLVIRNDGSQSTFPITVFRIPVDVVRQQVTQLVQGYNGVSINQIGGRLFLEGGVANEQQQRRVQQIAAIFPGQVESLVAVDPTIVERRINVRIDLYFVELSTNSNYVFGVNWPSSLFGDSSLVFNGTYQPFAVAGTTAGWQSAVATAIINQPLPRLDIASNAGWARVHRQATLVTANGNEATYHSGGEYNIRIANGLTADIRRIDYGSTITMTPRFDPSTSRVDVRVQADLSDLVDTGADIPGRSIARVNTLVNLQLGQSIVLSGMRGRSTTGGSQGLPLLAQIPILGALFGSQSRRNRENEMVIFIVPTVIEGMSRQAEDRVSAALRAYEDFGGILPGMFQENGIVPRPVERGPATAPAGR